MPTIQIKNSKGESKAIEYQVGLSLMEVLRDEGFEEILAMCGGCCSCATCHLHIDGPDKVALPEIEEDEQILIELADGYVQGASRLSCQIEMLAEYDGLEISLISSDTF